SLEGASGLSPRDVARVFPSPRLHRNGAKNHSGGSLQLAGWGVLCLPECGGGIEGIGHSDDCRSMCPPTPGRTRGGGSWGGLWNSGAHSDLLRYLSGTIGRRCGASQKVLGPDGSSGQVTPSCS